MKFCLLCSLQFCYDIICPPFQYEHSKDVFNAAQSGAMVPNLVSHEFDYLIKQLKLVCKHCSSGNFWREYSISTVCI